MISEGMERARVQLLRREHRAGGSGFALSLYREDFPDVYPGLALYSVVIECGGRQELLFRTNTYEYAPTVPLEAERVAVSKFEEWESAILASGTAIATERRGGRGRRQRITGCADVLVIQGSPRPGGNCSILAGYVKSITESLGGSASILFPADMDIKPCIGCYSCYNFGECVFYDDMEEVIARIEMCRLLVVCSPVYTNTVPGPLKNLVDRCQAYHARRMLREGRSGQKGILLSVAGRSGREPFDCVVKVLKAFMRNLGIEPTDTLLFDGLDLLRDIDRDPEAYARVESAVRRAFAQMPARDGDLR